MSVQMFTLEGIHKLQMEGINGDPDKLTQAKNLLEVIVNQHPDEFVPLFYFANSYLHAGRYGIAIALLQRCRELMPEVHEVYVNLGTAYRGEHKVAKAREALAKALEITPDDPDALNNLGTLHINEGNPEKGIEYLERAVKADPKHKQTHWNLGLCYLEAERWAEGFDKYTWGLSTKDRMVKNYQDAIWWDGKEHPDATMVVYGEQGIGDEIMFSSMIPELQKKVGTLIFDCHPRLIGMFERSFPGVIHYPTRKIFDRPLEWVDNYRIDYKISLGDVGKHLRRKEEDFPKTPYIKPDEIKVAKYREETKPALRGRKAIVLSWIGGHKKTRKDVRCVSLEKLTPLLDWAKRHDVAVISGQYTEHEEDVDKFCERTGYEILQYPEVFCSIRSERYYLYKADQPIVDDEGNHVWYKEKARAKDHLRQIKGGRYEHHYEKAHDYDETLAFVSAVVADGGAVVSVNNSLVHLCGAAGYRCFTLTPCKPAWRYGLARQDMVWYPWHSVRQYRQPWLDKDNDVPGDWAEPIDRLVSDLDVYFDEIPF